MNSVRSVRRKGRRDEFDDSTESLHEFKKVLYVHQAVQKAASRSELLSQMKHIPVLRRELRPEERDERDWLNNELAIVKIELVNTAFEINLMEGSRSTSTSIYNMPK